MVYSMDTNTVCDLTMNYRGRQKDIMKTHENVCVEVPPPPLVT